MLGVIQTKCFNGLTILKVESNYPNPTPSPSPSPSRNLDPKLQALLPSWLSHTLSGQSPLVTAPSTATAFM